MMGTSPDSLQHSDDDSDVRAALERRRRHLLEMSTTYLSADPSLGERLLPMLFACMEACWLAAILIALADIRAFTTDIPLMPPWTPFVLMVGAVWLTSWLERSSTTDSEAQDGGRIAGLPGSWLIYLLVVFTLLFVIWSGVYASAFLFFDPSWLLAAIGDLLSFSAAGFHILGLILLSFYCCWRGIRLARSDIAPDRVLRGLRIGIGVILAVVLLHAVSRASFANVPILLLLIPLFLFVALTAHALAHILFVRRAHPGGLQGNVISQERALLLAVGVMGIVLLLGTLLVSSFVSPAFLATAQQVLSPLGQVYEAFINVLATVVVFLLTPFFYLFSLIQFHLPTIRRPASPVKQPPVTRKPGGTTPEQVVAAIAILKVILPIVFIALVFFLIWWALRRRRVVLKRRSEDVAESVWSWDLFWSQLKAFFLALWRRFFPLPAVQAAQVHEEEIAGTPMVRNIRELYRAMLRWADGQGYPRKKDETPYEFRQRLDERMPLVEPELSSMTEVYAAIRYAGAAPDEADLAQVQKDWQTLQQKAQMQAQ
ncbi:MAG TPA: DUF4129 domain-containing protein [Ktedonobacteraceae bacterium]|nr:DUF4129 domain-containing protein [Ktedonobacteraceae bacterium]